MSISSALTYQASHSDYHNQNNNKGAATGMMMPPPGYDDQNGNYLTVSNFYSGQTSVFMTPRSSSMQNLLQPPKSVHYHDNASGQNTQRSYGAVSEPRFSNRPKTAGVISVTNMHSVTNQSSRAGRVRLLTTKVKPAVDEVFMRTSKMSLIETLMKGLFQHAQYILVMKPEQVNDRDEQKRTPLMLCAFVADAKWRVSLARSFLLQDAVLELRDSNGKTALHHACENARSDLVDLFLKAGCYPLLKWRDSRGQTPAQAAALHPLCQRAVEQNSPEPPSGTRPTTAAASRSRKSTAKRPVSAGASLYTVASQQQSTNKIIQWSDFEKKGKCPSFIDAMSVVPSLRQRLVVEDEGGCDNTSPTSRSVSTMSEVRRHQVELSAAASPLSALMMMHAEHSLSNFKESAKPTPQDQEALFRFLREQLEARQEEMQNNSKQKSKMFSAQRVAKQMLARRGRTSSIASSSNQSSSRDGEGVSVRSSTSSLETNSVGGASSFVTAPTRVSLASAANSHRS